MDDLKEGDVVVIQAGEEWPEHCGSSAVAEWDEQ